MTALRGKPGPAALVTAAALGAQLALLRFVLRADERRAYLFGHPVGVGCAFREHTGIPCPMCGVTRALGLSLHGELAHALRLFPAAPAACLGVAAGAVALVAAFILAWRNPGAARAFERRLRQGALTYAGLCTAVWLTDYAARVGALLR
ncbi:MAG TPA: DUF2752 domain-containing protein [Polyangiaceae bacterium]|jgi:hypothetical protein|nr:DUF2752 domain-containing protein [Polyangiaceae bacterium]